MTEAEYTTKKLLPLLKALPVSRWWKQHQGPYGERGVSDIIGCYKGRFIAIEVKDAKRTKDGAGGLTPHQTKFLASIQAALGKPIIVYTSADPKAVVEHIIALVNGKKSA